MLVIGTVSLLVSIMSYIFCIYVFGGFATGPQARKMVFASFICKSVCWAPFVGIEYYDTFFEQIYHDVKFQLNVVRPDGSRSPSPHTARGGEASPKSSPKAAAGGEEEEAKPVLQAAAEANEKSASASMLAGGQWGTKQGEDMRGPVARRNLDSCLTAEQQ